VEDIILWSPLAALAIFVVADFVRPARKFPTIRYWKIRGVAFTVASLALATVLPFLWADWAAAHRLFDLTVLGSVGGGLVAFAGLQFFSYWWHRLAHNVPFVWRWTHQMHHSAERVDIWGALIFHPFDLAAFTAIQTIVPMLLGVTPLAALISASLASFYSLFQHANIRTPQWLGYVIQRPESHSVHHQRGLHAFNYGDLPIWDLMFGTFRNPATWEGEAGFADGASARVLAMLLGRDVAPQSVPERYATLRAAAE